MFAKVFSQIFDSSISREYMVRMVFVDMLILCDRHGVVDMTVDAISRRTNVPEDVVLHAIEKLSLPDVDSRSPAAEGRRIVPLDSHRNWGWQIVNYQHYRNVVDDESRKAYFRDRMKDYRQRLKSVKDSERQLKKVTHAEAEADVKAEAIKVKVASANADKRATRIPPDFQVTEKHREWATDNQMPSPDTLIDEFVDFWKAKAGQNGTKVDWNATFRTWMRNAKQRSQGNGKRESSFGRISKMLEKVDGELAAERGSGGNKDRRT